MEVYISPPVLLSPPAEKNESEPSEPSPDHFGSSSPSSMIALVFSMMPSYPHREIKHVATTSLPCPDYQGADDLIHCATITGPDTY